MKKNITITNNTWPAKKINDPPKLRLKYVLCITYVFWQYINILKPNEFNKNNITMSLIWTVKPYNNISESDFMTWVDTQKHNYELSHYPFTRIQSDRNTTTNVWINSPAMNYMIFDRFKKKYHVL